MIGTCYGNKIDNLEKKIWPHCPTEILPIMNGIGWLDVTTQKKIIFRTEVIFTK